MAEAQIRNISWRRTYLFVEVQGDCLPVLKREQDARLFPLERREDGTFSLNLCIADGRAMLPRGSYRFLDADTGEELSLCEEIAVRYEELSRVFRYSEKKYAYTAAFSVREEACGLAAVLEIEFYGRVRNPARRHPLIEADSAMGFLKKSVNCFGRFGAGCYYRLCRLFARRDGKSILFFSQNRDFLSENLAALDRRLRERGGDYAISYSLNNIFEKKGNSLGSWLRQVAKIARADVIFTDDYVPVFSVLPLSKKTTLVQVWHAGFGFKLVGYGRFGIDGSPHPSISCHRKYDYGVIGCEALREIYSEVWGIEKDSLIASGMPRLDHFLDEETADAARAEFAEKHPGLGGKKIVLFAPTYRGQDQPSAYYDFTKVDFAEFYRYACENDALVLFKMHHFIREAVPIPAEYADRLIEITDMQINSLFYVTDVLITDYSSCFYDFALLNRPMLFYVYDEALYCATRGVHRPLGEVAPGRLCHSFGELIAALEQGDFQQEKREGFFTDRCAEGGALASDIVLNTVLK